MVPYRKSFNDDVVFDVDSLESLTVNPSNMTLQPEIQNRTQRNILVDSPLEEYAVFSDSEEENEYVQRMYSEIPKIVLPAKNRDVEVQCDIEEFIELKDILKLLSPCRFENATKSELQEFIAISKWVSMKYSVENCEQSPTVSTSLLSEKESGVESLYPSDATSPHSKKYTRLSKGPKKSSNKTKCDTNEQTSKKPKKRKVERSKSIYSSDLKNNTEDLAEPDTNLDKEASLHDEILKVKSNAEKCINRDSKIIHEAETDEINQNCRQSNQNMFSDNSVQNRRHTIIKPMPLSKKKKLFETYNKTGQRTSDKENGESKKAKPQPKKTVSDVPRDLHFKTPLTPIKSLARNWMNRNHSYCDPVNDNEKQKPHFASFQSHLKMRKLHSPREWLDSEEFAKSSQESR